MSDSEDGEDGEVCDAFVPFSLQDSRNLSKVVGPPIHGNEKNDD